METTSAAMTRSFRRDLTWRMYLPWRPRGDFIYWPLSQIRPQARQNHLAMYCTERRLQGMKVGYGLLVAQVALDWACYLLLGSRFYTWEAVVSLGLIAMSVVSVFAYASFWQRRGGRKENRGGIGSSPRCRRRRRRRAPTGCKRPTAPILGWLLLRPGAKSAIVVVAWTPGRPGTWPWASARMSWPRELACRAGRLLRGRQADRLVCPCVPLPRCSRTAPRPRRT